MLSSTRAEAVRRAEPSVTDLTGVPDDGIGRSAVDQGGGRVEGRARIDDACGRRAVARDEVLVAWLAEAAVSSTSRTSSR